MKKKEKQKRYLGIIFIGMGSSYYLGDEGESMGKVAIMVAKICRQDWGHTFKIKKSDAQPVNMFDATDGSGNWSCGTNGIVKDRDTGKELPRLPVVYATG